MTNLPHPYRTNCGMPKLRFFDSYSKSKCFLDKLTRYVIKQCHCRDWFMPGKSAMNKLLEGPRYLRTVKRRAVYIWMHVAGFFKRMMATIMGSPSSARTPPSPPSNLTSPLPYLHTPFVISPYLSVFFLLILLSHTSRFPASFIILPSSMPSICPLLHPSHLPSFTPSPHLVS